jgi:hypothetical protein
MYVYYLHELTTIELTRLALSRALPSLIQEKLKACRRGFGSSNRKWGRGT